MQLMHHPNDNAHYVCSYCWMTEHPGSKGPGFSVPFAVPHANSVECCYCGYESNRWTLIAPEPNRRYKCIPHSTETPTSGWKSVI